MGVGIQGGKRKRDEGREGGRAWVQHPLGNSSVTSDLSSSRKAQDRRAEKTAELPPL